MSHLNLTMYSNAKIIVKPGPTIEIYPTVPPETVIIPIISAILGFPILALCIICGLRYRAKLARDKARQKRISMRQRHRRMMDPDKSPDVSHIYKDDGYTSVKDFHRGKDKPDSKSVPNMNSASKPTTHKFTTFPVELELETVMEDRTDLEIDMTSVDIMYSPETEHYRSLKTEEDAV